RGGAAVVGAGGARRPEPAGRKPGHAVHRRGPVGDVLLPPPVPPGGLGILGGEGGPGLPADDRRDRRHLRRRGPAPSPGRRAAGHSGGRPGPRRRGGLAVAGPRAPPPPAHPPPPPPPPPRPARPPFLVP